MSEGPPPKRILVIDDDPDVRALLEGVLAEEGFRVDVAVNGGEGLERVLQAAPDLVILDVEMPVMTGWEVLTRLKGDAWLRHLPVLMLTGMTQSQHKVRGLDLGADDYLAKPFDIAEVAARVRGALRRSAADLEANPLTRLPGNNSIEREIVARISAGVPFAVLYADLNDFKAFNDRYGFSRGDQLLQETARILRAAAQAGEFVGHVGGDDFIVVGAPENAEAYCRRVIAEFDAGAAGFYDPADREKGGIELADRRGQSNFFPIVGIAIGGVTNTHRSLTSIGQVSGLGAEMKKFAKQKDGSAYAFDRRTG
jgi:PleD family two-component response regulator